MKAIQSKLVEHRYGKERKRELRVKSLLQSDIGQQIINADGRRQHVEEGRALLQNKAHVRKQQEEDTSKGSGIWFSRYIVNGELDHWAFIARETRYKLAREDSHFIYRQENITVDDARREIILAELPHPESDGYYFGFIGWTEKNDTQIENAVSNVLKSSGTTDISRNNCQDFLKRVSDQMLITDRAIDYLWFREHTDKKYQKDKWLPTPPIELQQRLLNSLDESLGALKVVGGIRPSPMQVLLQEHIDQYLQYQSIGLPPVPSGRPDATLGRVPLAISLGYGANAAFGGGGA